MTTETEIAEPSSTVDGQPGPGPPRPRRRLAGLGRTVLGLAVLGAIVGGLLAFDRLGADSELGALDGRSPEVGEPAPNFALRDPDGRVHRLIDFRGRLVWINFWATTCGPCRRELPDIQRFADKFKDDGLVVLAVNQQESADTALSFWDELNLHLPILLDSDREVSNQYQLFGLPNNFFIDRDGTLRSHKLGFLTEEEMRDRLAELGLK